MTLKLNCVSGIHSDRCYCTKQLTNSCSLVELELLMEQVAESVKNRPECTEHKGEHLSFPFPRPHILSSLQTEPISPSPLFPLVNPEVLRVGA